MGKPTTAWTRCGPSSESIPNDPSSSRTRAGRAARGSRRAYGANSRGGGSTTAQRGPGPIPADPRDLRAVKRLNSAIKQRDFWMPFAPSILEGRMADYLVGARPARYMIEAFDTTAAGRGLAAALHPQDGTP